MARDWNAYYRLLRSLLPRGRAWTPDSGTLKEFLQGKAVELARLDSRVEDLLIERSTLTANELLPEHETDFGLPDGCLDPSVMTMAERRAALNTKLRTLGTLRKNYYIALAESLGYTGVTIDEYVPFWCGLGVSGDPCGDQEMLFYWTLKWTYDMTKPMQDGQDIECLATRYRPAHTVLIVQLVGPGFSNGFSNGFYAVPPIDLSLGGGFSVGFESGFEVYYGGPFDGQAFSDGFEKTYNPFGY